MVPSLVQAVALVAHGHRIPQALVSTRLKRSSSEVSILGWRRRDCFRGIAHIFGDLSTVGERISGGTRFQVLPIGSAAGVGLMGQARGSYTFYAPLKWIWAIALGYTVSITVHILMNAALFRP